MNIEKFFELSAGKWFAHRSTHDLTNQQSVESKSEIMIELLDEHNAEVVQLCETHQIDPKGDRLAWKVTWNDTTRLNQKNTGSIVILAVPNPDGANTGKLFFSNQSQAGEYKLGEDEALTLTLNTDQTKSEERLWFASDNLRMRVSTFTQADGVSRTAFTSEIRMASKPPSQSQVAQSASS